jgi:hypothetical protein
MPTKLAAAWDLLQSGNDSALAARDVGRAESVGLCVISLHLSSIGARMR